jgi:hypothetical protein
MSTEKYPQHMLFLGEAIETGLVKSVKGREGYIYHDGMYRVEKEYTVTQ